MYDTAKYLVHADITAEGVVERSDVVGAVFGQTEGLLGDELDLRDLQDSSKVGRIDVDVDSQNGQSFGRITIATSLDRVETAILAAALETIDRVGPCRSTIEVRRIEDVRAARRREVVERAKTLLAEAFDESVPSSRDLVEEVREAVRVEDITEYRGLPAGPNVADADGIVVVEGRADVLTLLRYGIKNAVAVEGTNVPDAVADLTTSRTVTAFLDGDRGGELILRELAQVGDVDYVAFAPEGQSVEDLDRATVLSALREKVPYERVRDADDPGAVVASRSDAAGSDGQAGSPAGSADADGEGVGTAATRASGGSADERDRPERSADSGAESVADTDAGGTDADPAGTGTTAAEAAAGPDVTIADPDAAGATDEATASDGEPAGGGAADAGGEAASGEPAGGEAADAGGGASGAEGDAAAGGVTVEPDVDAGDDGEQPPETLRGHVRAVIGEGSGTVRLLDAEFGVLAEDDAAAAFDRLAASDEPVAVVVLDGELDQRLLDVAAQQGVEQVVATSTGEFVKRPTSVRIRTGEELLAANQA